MYLSAALRRALPLPRLTSFSTLIALHPTRTASSFMPPKRKRVTKEVIVSELTIAETAAVASEPVSDPVTLPLPTPRRRASTRAKKSVSYADQQAVNEDATRAESPLTDLDAKDTDDVPKSPAKKRRRKKDTEPVVYDIPPVEIKETTFKGRLGYACLNTILRATKPEPIFCSRTCRKDTIHKNGIDFAKDLGKQNARDLCKLIQWNEENNIKFLRISSEMFPFASHGELGYDLEYAKDELKAAGDLAKRLGHRLTTHPGQFTQLASPKENVVDASVRELEYHCQMMRYMGLGKDSVIIIHMGGVYGDKETTLARFKENYAAKLTDEMKARLVLENDEMCYNVDDLFPVCNELDIPIIFDYHHNWIYPSVRPVSEVIPLINEIWHRKGIKPKQHLSSPRPGAESVMEKRAHADRCYELPPELPDDMDLMIEAKDKEQAVFHLYRVYNLHPVIYDNLRPEKPPKPFERSPRKVKKVKNTTGEAGEGGEEGMGDGEDVAEDRDAESPKKRKTRARKGKGGVAKADSSAEVETLVGIAPSVPETPSKPPRKRATKTKKSQQEAEHAFEEDTAIRMMNQEEYAQPVDGGDIEKVEEDEHPEVMSAAKEQKKTKR